MLTKSAKTVTDNPNHAVKEAFVTALFAGDWDRAAPHLDPDFTLIEPALFPYGGEHKGLPAFRACLDTISRYMSDRELDERCEFFSADPDRIISELAFKGRIIATGEMIESMVLEHWVFRNGKIWTIAPCWLHPPMLTPL